MASLNLNDYVPQASLSPAQSAEQTASAKKVKSMGYIALLLVVCGFIPVIGIFTLIGALVLSRKAMTISRKNLVPVEYEKPAHWASIISKVLLILWVIGLVFAIL